MEKSIKDNKAEVIEINKKGKIDKDTFIVKRLINTDTDTYLRYTFIGDGFGWSLPKNSFSFIDNNEKEYKGISGGSTGKIWGEEGLIIFERVPKDIKEITLIYKKFDRLMEIAIPLINRGEKVE